MRRPVRFSFGLILGSAALVGCSPANIVCPQIAAPAILLEVREDGTGAPAANGARGVVEDGGYVDSLRVVGWSGPPAPETELYMAAAFDRPGTYSVRLEKAGYQTWIRTNIVVGTDDCGTQQVQFATKLVPIP